MNQAILLCRVSSDRQAEGYSLDYQEKDGRAYAAKHGLELVHIVRLAESASKEARSGWAEFLRRARTGTERHVLFARQDRASRNFDDLAALYQLAMKHGKVLHFFYDGFVFSQDSTPADEMRFGVQGSLAKHYIADLKQKILRGRAEKLAQGGWPGVAPFGYRNDRGEKTIVVDPVYAPWAVRIKRLAAIGLYSLRRIIAMLRAEGYPDAQRPLHINQVERLIRNPFHAGVVEFKGARYPGAHEPLITWEEHEAAVRGLERLNRPKYGKHLYAFAGIMRCGHCEPAHAVVWEAKKGGRYIYGHCSMARKPKCPHSVYVTEETIEEQARAALRDASVDQELADRIMAGLAERGGEETAQRMAQLAQVRQELGRLRARLEQAYTDKLDGKVTEEFWSERQKRWMNEQARLEGVAATLETTGADAYLPRARGVLELAKNLENAYLLADQEKKRRLVDAVLSNLTLTGKKLGYAYRLPYALWASGVDPEKWWCLVNDYRTWLQGPEAARLWPEQHLLISAPWGHA